MFGPTTRQLRRLLFGLAIAGLAFGTFGAAPDVESDYYTAGVVEFRPVVAGMSSADMLADHLAAYLAIIASAEASATDILVFPEGTLNNALQPTFVPAPSLAAVPCDGSGPYADFLVRLSCAARDARKYVVINLTEQEQCAAAAGDDRPCAADGLNVYNTNVALDRTGRVVSRYRKVHIYLEAKNTTRQPEFGIFETDFGVTFGHFICFDLLFYTPALELVERWGVHDIIFTSWFYSELPFLTGVQLQQSWSWGADVNFLAAGASYPQAGTTGSGIYAGSAGQLVSLMVGEESGGVRRLLVARVPKRRPLADRRLQAAELPNTQPTIELPLMRDPQIEQFNSTLLELSEALDQVATYDLCHADLCCHFELRTAETAPGNGSASQAYRYRVGAFSGERSYEKAELSNLKICALYACLNESVTSCALLLPSTALVRAQHSFAMLQISGEFAKAPRRLLMPNSLTWQLYPLPAEMLLWRVVEDESRDQKDRVSFELNAPSPADNLLTFAIYANYYDKSAAAAAINAVMANALALTLLAASLACARLIMR